MKHFLIFKPNFLSLDDLTVLIGKKKKRSEASSEGAEKLLLSLQILPSVSVLRLPGWASVRYVSPGLWWARPRWAVWGWGLRLRHWSDFGGYLLFSQTLKMLCKWVIGKLNWLLGQEVDLCIPDNAVCPRPSLWERKQLWSYLRAVRVPREVKAPEVAAASVKTKQPVHFGFAMTSGRCLGGNR